MADGLLLVEIGNFQVSKGWGVRDIAKRIKSAQLKKQLLRQHAIFQSLWCQHPDLLDSFVTFDEI